MYLSTKIYICITIFFFHSLFAQELVNIGILSSYNLTSIKVFFQTAYSAQFDNNTELWKLNPQQFYQIEVIQDSLVLLNNIDGKQFKAKNIYFYSPDIYISEFSIINHSKKSRTYKGNFKVSALSGKLSLVNVLNLDDYVCGVVSAEVGKDRHPEFYKAQAVLVRTYALSHLNKHITEGFNLCDEVHCQVYYGDCLAPPIKEAVASTHNIVIIDKELNLIVAAFHSNSGGQTVNSEDIWGSKKDYLRSVQDTFSIGMPSYKWKKKISLEEWKNYLKKYKYPTEDEKAMNYILNFKQYNRSIYIQYNSVKIPLKSIREELKLMSTLFDIELNETKDSIIFYGRGFGHGVGLSQEGAMKMAKLGFEFKQMIEFYYQNITLIDLKKLNFFRDE